MAEVVELSCLATHVQSQVETIMKHSNIGLCHRNITFMNPKPSCPECIADAKCDRFKMIIPYAGVSVECLVIFQDSRPDVPPDFIFSDTSFVVPIERVKTLCSWDAQSSDGLLNALKELLQIYKRKQISHLGGYSYLRSEYISVVKLPNFSEEEIEVFVPYNKHNPVTFLIRLRVDFNKFLPAYFQGTREQNAPLLLVTFPLRDSNRYSQRLYVSSKIAKFLGFSQDFRMPSAPTDFCLKKLIPVLEDELIKKAELLASAYERRKKYIATFLSHFEHCLVEYDMLLFMKLALLLEQDGFIFLLEINFPQNFPIGVPLLTFRSVYHTYAGVPVSVVINSYPYSHEWSMHEVMLQTVKFVEDYIPLFQQDSTPLH